jgi:hypothetical protein
MTRPFTMPQCQHTRKRNQKAPTLGLRSNPTVRGTLFARHRCVCPSEASLCIRQQPEEMHSKPYANWHQVAFLGPRCHSSRAGEGHQSSSMYRQSMTAEYIHWGYQLRACLCKDCISDMRYRFICPELGLVGRVCAQVGLSESVSETGA